MSTVLKECVMNFRQQIGRRIAAARKAMHWTIKELATQTQSLSPARIGNWEQGTRSPGPMEAMLLAKHLNVSASYLLCLTSQPEGELDTNAGSGMRHLPVFAMQDLDHAKELMLRDDASSSLKTIVVDGYNTSLLSESLYATTIDDQSMAPRFSPGDVVIFDADKKPQPGNHVLVYLSEKKKVALRRYGESEDCCYQLIASNELWANINVVSEDSVSILGAVVEHRCFL